MVNFLISLGDDRPSIFKLNIFANSYTTEALSLRAQVYALAASKSDRLHNVLITIAKS